MKKLILILFLIIGLANADSYTLSLVTDGGQGHCTFPTTTSLEYTHDGSVVPTSPTVDASGWTGVLDSIEIKATDEGSNEGVAWLYIKIMPVNDHKPVITSDTLTCLEGNSVTFSPIVTDGDN